MRLTISKTTFGVAAALTTLLVALPLRAQQTAAVHGTITDAASGAAIGDARVLVAGTSLQSMTNALGSYRITGIRPGNVTLLIQRIGYKTVNAPITLAEGQELTQN